MSRNKLWIACAAGSLVLTLSMTRLAETRTARGRDAFALQENLTAQFPELPSAGKKCRIDDDFYFTYGFTEKPRMGTAILRVRVFDKDGTGSTAFIVLGRSDMPSMAGAHDSGDQEFKLNRKGDYLLPVNIVMPGEWEVKLTFKRGEEIILRGVFRFNV